MISRLKKPPFFLNYILHLDRKRSQSNNNAASSVSLESHLYMQLCLVNGFVYGFSSFCGEFSKKISKSILKKVWLPTIKIADLLFLKTGLKSFKTWNQDIFKTGVSGARSSLFRFTRRSETSVVSYRSLITRPTIAYIQRTYYWFSIAIGLNITVGFCRSGKNKFLAAKRRPICADRQFSGDVARDKPPSLQF